MEQGKIFVVKKIPEDKLNKFYEGIIKMFLNFDNLSQNDYEKFLKAYLTYIVNRDNVLPIYFRLEKILGMEDTPMLTSHWNKNDGAMLTFNPDFQIWEKPESMQNLTAIILGLEHEIAHNFDFKNWERIYQKFDNELGKKSYDYRSSSLSLLDHIFTGTKFEELFTLAKRYIKTSSHDEHFAMKRAPFFTTKFFIDIQSYALKHNIELPKDAEKLYYCSLFENNAVDKLFEESKNFFADKKEVLGYRFSDLKTEVLKLFENYISGDFASTLYMTEEKIQYLQKNEKYFLAIQDHKCFFDQKTVDKLFEKETNGKDLYLDTAIQIANLFYNKNSKAEYQKIAEIVKRQGQIDVLEKYISGQKHKVPLSRTPEKFLSELIKN
ncbi:MAG: hypothetical protein IJF22_01385 [Clostridia bacterium]|nr:hypothetical protein [Clostridia bacterium]